MLDNKIDTNYNGPHTGEAVDYWEKVKTDAIIDGQPVKVEVATEQINELKKSDTNLGKILKPKSTPHVAPFAEK